MTSIVINVGGAKKGDRFCLSKENSQGTRRLSSLVRHIKAHDCHLPKATPMHTVRIFVTNCSALKIKADDYKVTTLGERVCIE